MPRPIRASFRLSALKHNLGVARRHAPKSRVWAVVKADAYGHGLARVAQALAAADGAAGVAAQMARYAQWTLGLNAEASLANSAALLRYPETHADWVRPGIMLYGCSPFAGVGAQALGLRRGLPPARG